MPKVSLNAHFVNSITCPAGKTKENYYDTSITGFILETRATGGKTYALRYKDQHGRQCQHKIGDSKSISFDKARNAALIIRSRVVLGENPAAEKRTLRLVPTLAEFCEERYMPFVKGDKRSWKSDESYLRCHILPKFGTYHLDKINQQAVIEFHHSMRAHGYALGTANLALVRLKYIFNLALRWEIPGVKSNPAAGVKLFEANNGRERFLTADETQRLCVTIEKSQNTQLKFIVPLLLLLGCRKHELLDSRWTNFDLERRSWRIPLAKSGKARHVPLSKAAIEILAQLPRWEGCPFVIPNTSTLKPFVNIHRAWNNARIAAGLPEVRMHDLRHSMASNMVNSGRSIYEVANVLGHSQLKTTQRYAHLSQETLLAAVDAAADATGKNWGQVQTVKL
ncbi:MAG: tyrosine-type recombinase/integrase [Desulfobacteraceae bacterium]|nr:tyrosine-type recombinase/integrase [Desulfobacteraceae bacterium]